MFASFVCAYVLVSILFLRIYIDKLEFIVHVCWVYVLFCDNVLCVIDVVL